jgi:hypothetical protein
LKITHPATTAVFVMPHANGISLKQGKQYVHLPPAVARVVADTISDALEDIPIPRNEIAVGVAE